MVELHRIEDRGMGSRGPYLELSFETCHRGIWQCLVDKKGLHQFRSEPPFRALKKEEQKYIERASYIIFLLTEGEAPNI